jgi:hypothetical protein
MEESTDFVLPRLSFDLKIDSAENRQAKLWSLPKPVYWHIGKIIVLKVKLAEKNEGAGGDDEWIMRALTLPPDDFVKLLFCNVDIHKRLRYQERVDMLAEGKFNGTRSW